MRAKPAWLARALTTAGHHGPGKAHLYGLLSSMTVSQDVAAASYLARHCILYGLAVCARSMDGSCQLPGMQIWMAEFIHSECMIIFHGWLPDLKILL